MPGKDAPLAALIPEIVEPPVVAIGTLEVDEFLSPRARKELAAEGTRAVMRSARV